MCVYNLTVSNFQPTERNGEFRDIMSRFQSGFPSIVDCEEGWNEIIANCHNELKEIDDLYTIAQIKEKFGVLRYYFASSNPLLYKQMSDIVRKYEQMSSVTCEVCGNSGELRTGSRLRTLCAEHAKEV